MAHKEQESVVIVESPAKAATIEKYLGRGYTVLASYGHVRDLLNKSGSVSPDNDFAMVWALSEKAQKPIEKILQATKNSKALFLATDPDREGEAIAWHLSQIITAHYGAKCMPIQRVVFHEITKNAVLSAMQKPHDLDLLLVDAYLARRALDYLVGYSLSPILWQKLPGARSAGRVQSVALRMIVEREQAIEQFDSQEYWSIDGLFHSADNTPFRAKLVNYAGTKLAKLDIHSEAEAQKICSALQPLQYHIASVEKKVLQRNPAPPFTTSTLQQEASRKLGFGASRTMRLAQRLYEGVSIDGEGVGLITYMRTDSTNLSTEAVAEMRTHIQDTYGDAYLPADARIYKTKAKNAQEAHEAIRPTSVLRTPEQVANLLEPDALALYTLIWKRAVASQMANAVFDQVSAEIIDPEAKHTFRAVGTTQIFDGFLKLYQEGSDNEAEHATSAPNENLPILHADTPAALKQLAPEQHFTQPPPRFTEASLVKKLEELGIGRPSTYAPLMQVLQDREYVTLDRRQFHPSDRGRIVTAFLTNFGQKYVAYDFTAQLEEELDEIASGKIDWKKVMRDFWVDFSQAVEQMKNIRVTEVIDKLEQDLSSYLFPDPAARKCTACADGMLGLKLSKFGAFLGCSNYPECTNRRYIGANGAQEGVVETIELGEDPIDHAKISLHHGPYGYYIQADWPVAADAKKSAKPKTKRTGLPAGVTPDNVTLDYALQLKRLPLVLGQLAEEEISVNIGRFGPFVKCGDVLASIPKTQDFLTLRLEDAIQLVEAKKAKGTRPRRAPARKPARRSVKKS